MARRIGLDETNLPPMRRDRGFDRAPLPRPGEDWSAGHDVDRPCVRRPAQARAGSCTASRCARRCGGGSSGRAASRRDAAPHPGADRPQSARPGVAARRLRHARNRPRARRRRERRRGAGGGRGDAARGSPGVTALRKPDTPTTVVELSGMAAALDLSGALYLPDADALVVADLHLEKGSAFARRGLMLPPYDTRETLRALAAALARYVPRTVIALGDSFHDQGGPDRLGSDDRRSLAALQAGRRWVWITGNHDRVLPDEIGGEVLNDLALGSLILRHEPT